MGNVERCAMTHSPGLTGWFDEWRSGGTAWRTGTGMVVRNELA